MDISGRHEEAGEYLMVAAAVHAVVDSDRIRSVLGVGFADRATEPTLVATTALVREAVERLPERPEGPIVAERGEFYEKPPASVAGHMDAGPEFKYVETIAERETVQAAHHAAYAARQRLL